MYCAAFIFEPGTYDERFHALDALTIGFGVAVIATVFIGKKMPVRQGVPA